MNTKQFYQGDIPIIKINKEDKEIKYEKLPIEGFVVAEGETTGHKHTIVADREAIVEIAKDEFGYFLNVKNGSATITHEEHKPIVIEKGIYFIGNQWEYLELDEMKKVSD